MCPMPTMILTPLRQMAGVGLVRGGQLSHPSSDYLHLSGPTWEVLRQWNSSTEKRESEAVKLKRGTQDSSGRKGGCLVSRNVAETHKFKKETRVRCCPHNCKIKLLRLACVLLPKLRKHISQNTLLLTL